MTSQLILGNGHGIAIASDSAVTMGRRTFETSEKIYPLPLPHRLAVMHSGAVMFHGLPYGTVINEWIKSLGDVQLRSVGLYQESFVSWLLDNYKHWTTATALDTDILWAFRQDMNRIWERLHQLEDPMDADSVTKVWQSELQAAEAFDRGNPQDRPIAERIFARLWPKDTHDGRNLEELYEQYFDDVARSDEIDSLARNYMITSIERRYPNSEQSYSQLVFVGYGSTEMTPNLYSCAFFGALPEWLYEQVLNRNEARRVGYGLYLINPFGQFDAIDLVFRGFDLRFIQATKSAVTKAFEGESEFEISDDDPRLDYMNKLPGVIEDSFYDFSESTRLQGLRRSIAGMPLATLARTAKSLIEVQRLSLDIAGELQTVGGSVDVGVVTLKDGFQWIRQKEFGDYVE